MKVLLIRELKELAGIFVAAVIVGVALTSNHPGREVLVFGLLTKSEFELLPQADSYFQLYALLGFILCGVLFGFVSFGKEHWSKSRDYLLHRSLSAQAIVNTKFLAGVLAVAFMWILTAGIWTLRMRFVSPIESWVESEFIIEGFLFTSAAWPSFAIGAFFAGYLGSKRYFLLPIMLLALIGQLCLYLFLLEGAAQSPAQYSALFLILNLTFVKIGLKSVASNWIRSGDEDRKLSALGKAPFALSLILLSCLGWSQLNWKAERLASAAATSSLPFVFVSNDGSIETSRRSSELDFFGIADLRESSLKVSKDVSNQTANAARESSNGDHKHEPVFEIDVSGWRRAAPTVKVLERGSAQSLASAALAPSTPEGQVLAACSLALLATAPPVALWSSFDSDRSWTVGGRHSFDSDGLDVSNPWPILGLNLLAAALLGFFSIKQLDITPARKRFWIAACLVLGPAGYASARLFESRLFESKCA